MHASFENKSNPGITLIVARTVPLATNKCQVKGQVFILRV